MAVYLMDSIWAKGTMEPLPGAYICPLGVPYPLT